VLLPLAALLLLLQALQMLTAWFALWDEHDEKMEVVPLVVHGCPACTAADVGGVGVGVAPDAKGTKQGSAEPN